MPTGIEKLGALEREYDTNQIGRYLTLVISIGLIGGGAYLIYSAALAREMIIWIMGGILAALLIFIGVMMIRRFLNNRGGTIRLYRNGLEAVINGKSYVGTWDDFEGIQEIITENRVNGIHVSSTYSYFVKLKNGDYFLLDETFFGVKEIGERLRDETFERLYPASLKGIESGEKVNFGKILIDSSGLTTDNRTFLWTQLGDFTIEGGDIKLTDKNGKKVWSEIYANVLNAHVLAVILRDFIKK